MSIVFPVDMPPGVLIQGLNENWLSQSVFSNVDSGMPPKIRMRFSEAMTSCKVAYSPLTQEQMDGLKAFYKTNQASQFDWFSPRNNTVVSAYFDPASKPSFTPISDVLWKATLDFRYEGDD
jgi:hypothetical protein